MKIEPRYGYYPWWPEDGNDWLHPEDVDQARRIIPSMRVFRRDGEWGDFVVLHYGEIKLRVKRTLWQEVDGEGYELGDWVEVLSRCKQNEPRTGTIREITWGPRAFRYQIFDSHHRPIANFYTANDLRHIEPTIEGLNRT